MKPGQKIDHTETLKRAHRGLQALNGFVRVANSLLSRSAPTTLAEPITHLPPLRRRWMRGQIKPLHTNHPTILAPEIVFTVVPDRENIIAAGTKTQPRIKMKTKSALLRLMEKAGLSSMATLAPEERCWAEVYRTAGRAAIARWRGNLESNYSKTR
ncbi:MAG: hypothetical protein ACREQI_11085 [Candidatus Binataceae bacterium]